MTVGGGCDAHHGRQPTTSDDNDDDDDDDDENNLSTLYTRHTAVHKVLVRGTYRFANNCLYVI